ncbi:MAG: hypothetical protein ABSA30_07670, partial [Candidatus Aminicenantales bacterium]
MEIPEIRERALKETDDAAPRAVAVEVVVDEAAQGDHGILEDLAGFGPLSRFHGRGIDDVGTRGLIAHVVGLESGRQRARVEQKEPVSVLLGDVQAPAPAGQRGGPGVEPDGLGVRPLEIMHGRGLQAQDVFGAAFDAGPAEPAADDPVAFLVQEAPAVDGQAEGVLVEDPGQGVGLQVAHDPGGQDADPLLSLVDVLLGPEDAIVGKGLDLFLAADAGRVDVRVLPGGQGVQEADVPAAQLAGELGRP